MGVVLRPAVFQRPPSAPPPRARRRRRRWIDGRIAAILVAMAGLAWLLAIAGTAFAFRMIPVMCFALMAGRARREPNQARS